jgi:hypothetical protein
VGNNERNNQHSYIAVWYRSVCTSFVELPTPEVLCILTLLRCESPDSWMTEDLKSSEKPQLKLTTTDSYSLRNIIFAHFEIGIGSFQKETL